MSNLSEEEKKAIKCIKEDMNYAEEDNYMLTATNTYYLVIVLNLINRLQKENEELKEKNKERKQRIINLENKIIQQKRQIKKYIDNKPNYVSKDKIKDKIKELEEIIKVVTTYEQVLTAMYTVGILKELLEE